MPALSKKQQKFMGIVRSIQKGEQPASKFNKDAQDVAKDMKKTDVKKFASTKHKGLPMKKEMFSKINKMIKQELKEYTYGIGDVVKDVNPSCPHYGAEGKVKSVSPRSVVFIVKNKGDNFKPGQELEKTHDQMKKIDESLNENRDFEKLYNLFTKKDYFNLKNSIKQMLRNYDVALKKGDKGAQKYTKQDVIKSVTAQNKENAKRVYDELVTAIKKKDIRRLKSRLRYDQPYSLAIFNQITGKKLPKTNSGILSFLDNEFMKESVNEKYIKLHPKEKIIVNYRNKKKGFKSDKKVFNDYGKALQWGRKNVANFKKDMISFEIPESVNESFKKIDSKKLKYKDSNGNHSYEIIVGIDTDALDGKTPKIMINYDGDSSKATKMFFLKNKDGSPYTSQQSKSLVGKLTNKNTIHKFFNQKIPSKSIMQTLYYKDGKFVKESINEMSAKSKKIISKLGKKEKEMFSTMVDMMGFDQVMADYKRDKKAFKQALADMSENINEKKKPFPPLKMTPKQAKEYKKFIGYAKMGVEYRIDMSLFESINEDGHTDVASAKRKAMLVVDDANKLLNKLNGMNKEDSLPSWLSDKITIAQTNLSKSSDYLNNPVESVNEFRDKKEADTARDQIGNKALYMIGAKDFVFGTSGGKKSLVFKIMRNSKGVSHIRMRLSSMDLYDIEFLAIRAGKIKVKSKEKGVYGDQLGVMIKKNTGLNIRL